MIMLNSFVLHNGVLNKQDMVFLHLSLIMAIWIIPPFEECVRALCRALMISISSICMVTARKKSVLPMGQKTRTCLIYSKVLRLVSSSSEGKRHLVLILQLFTMQIYGEHARNMINRQNLKVLLVVNTTGSK